MKEKKSFEILVLAENNNGYISARDAKEKGICQQYLVLAEEAGQFNKVARGLYVKKGHEIDPYYILQYTYKKAVFSLESALYLHDLITSDLKISVNLPRGYMNKGIKNVNCLHVNEKEYFLGLGLLMSKAGHIVTTYDLERTFIDAYRYKDRNTYKMRDVFNNFKKKDFDQNKLLEYAKELKVEEAIDAYLSLI